MTQRGSLAGVIVHQNGMKGAALRQALIGVVAFSFVISVAGCNRSSSSPESPAAQSPGPAPTENQTGSADVRPLLPSHNFTDKIGDIYYYPGSVSKNAEDDGRAAADAIGFRYLGKNQSGDFVVMEVNSQGMPEIDATCANPCHIIRSSDGRTIVFNPSSVIGAVFEDAMNGQLEEPAPPATPTPAVTAPADSTTQAANDAAQVAHEVQEAQNNPVRPPAMPGECFETAVRESTTVLEGPNGAAAQAGMGLAMTFADGHRLLHYAGHPEALPWRTGDPVRICLSRTATCSTGRPQTTWHATNLRDGSSWQAVDSVRSCN